MIHMLPPKGSIMTMPTRNNARPRGVMQFTPRQLAWAAVLFEAAQSDKIVKTIEITQIIDILQEEFTLERSDALSLCERYSRDNRKARSRDVMARASQVLKSSEKAKIEDAVANVIYSDGYVAPEEEVFMTVTNMSIKG